MLKRFLLILISTVSMNAQFTQLRWKCDPKDGKFIVTPGANSKKFYCWDGQIFSETPGYTPPPAYVLSYWEEVHRKSEQIRQDLNEQAERAGLTPGRVNQPATSQGTARNTVSTLRATPKTMAVSAPTPESAPIKPPIARAKVGEIQVGMDRDVVEKALGKPHGSMAIPDGDDVVETLTYNLEDHATARIRIEKGQVASVKIVG